MKELAEALAAAQAQFIPVEKSATNPHFKSTYAPLDAIIKMAQPILSKAGLCVMHTSDLEGDVITVKTIILHTSGQSCISECKMRPRALDPQSVGGAITYGRRYGLGMALGIATEEDRDGNGLGKKDHEKPEEDLLLEEKAEPLKSPTITENQRNFFFAKCREAGLTKEQIKAIMSMLIGKDSTKEMTSKEMTSVLEFMSDSKRVAQYKIHAAKQEELI